MSSIRLSSRVGRTAAVALLLALGYPVSGAQVPDPLRAGFLATPRDAKPHTWWHWMNGNVSREGITRDIESIHAAGFGGVQLFNVGLDIPPGDATFMSPRWRELFSHAARECERLGLDFSVHTCDGWSQSGGTWVTPEFAMQKVTTSELRVSTPGPATLRLPQPLTVRDYYKDIAVLAFPTPPEDNDTQAALGPTVTTDVPRLPDEEAKFPAGSVVLPKPATGTTRTATWSFERPFTARSLAFGFRSADGPADAVLEVSDDGITYRPVVKLPTPAESFSMEHLTTAAFPAVTGRHFRVTVLQGGRLPNVAFRLTLHSGDRVDRYENKAGDAPRDSTTAWSARAASPGSLVDPKLMVDLTDRLRPDGTLDWVVPGLPEGASQWTVLRIGHTLTGRTNQAATPEGRGLECDKLNPDAVRAHFDAFAAKILDENRDRIGRSINFLHLDSWEALCQNWTPRMREEFTRLRGYDPKPYYPVLTGRIVTSLEVSERFLFDLRRTVADLIRDNHFKLLTKLCNDRGVRLHAEALGPNMPTIAHGLECKAVVDVGMGEFWVGREIRADCKEAAASAQIHGKSLVPAEAFTAVRGDFTDDFLSLKPLGDAAFAMGINKFVFHRFVHQPWPERFPGMGMGPYGINFERTNTVWPEVRTFTDYLTRSQFLLRQGRTVSDVLYYTGENVPHMLPPRRELRPELPQGWDYGACSTDELLELTTTVDAPSPGAKHRMIAFPSGARFHVLVMPDTPIVSPRVLAKVRELVRAGAVVVGPRPTRSPSLTGFPDSDTEVRAIASELWGPGDGSKSPLVHTDVPLATLLNSLGVPQDVQILSAMLADKTPADRIPTSRPNSGTVLNVLHRRTDSDEIYFLANPHPAPLDAVIRFRDARGQPELWNPATGESAVAPLADPNDPSTLQISLDPSGSVFVIFRAASPARVSFTGPDPRARLTRHNNALVLTTLTPGTYSVVTHTPGTTPRTATVDVATTPTPTALGGPWEVRFTHPAPVLGEPFTVTFPELVSWHLHPDKAVKGFSGTAVYSRRFSVDRVDPDRPVFLDLGALRNHARVRLNGRDLELLWKPPFHVDLSPALRAGDNDLEISVTNLWPNRLIADAALPVEERRSFTTTSYYNADSKPLESGLFGPVRLLTGSRRVIPTP